MPAIMYVYRLLLLLACFSLYNLSGCEPCDIFFPAGSGPPLTIERDSDALRYRVGETIWIGGSFPSLQTVEGKEYRITDGGGLIITQIFSFEESNDTVRAGRDEFTPIEDIGDVLPSTISIDPATVALRFTCTGGTCSFRQGFRAEEPGTYLFQPRGSTIDLIDSEFEVCSQPSFGPTTLESGTNSQGLNLTFPLIYQDSGFVGRVDTFQFPLFAVVVE